MKELLAPYTEQLADLRGMRRQVIIARNFLRRKNPYTHIEFVAGPITSFGPEREETNRAALIKAADFLHEQRKVATFCTPYLGNLTLLEGVQLCDIRTFTVDLIQKKLFHGITLVGDWKKSEGSWLEYQAALEVGLPVTELLLSNIPLPK